ncbi:hypothetical protein SpCBS45565_g03573 [Spizellomyces sp. 'palustris']|nr:hypothetical protein SpCBS45565_g03573 [Spizellomyces sp. 'palustris']
MFSFGPQTPKVTLEEAIENRAKVRQSFTKFLTVVAAIRIAPFLVEYAKELL